MKKIKVLLVGSGNMATEHFKAFSSFVEFKFVGVVARNKKKLSQFSKKNKIPYFSTNIEEAYYNTKPDLIIIAISELSVFEVCKKLSKFNSVLLIEKPLGYNYQESKKITSLFSKKKTLAFVALNRRHFNSTRKLQAILLNQKGKRLITVNDQENLIEQRNNKVPKKIVDNFMYANSVHLIDYFSIFCRGNLKEIKTFNYFNKDPFFVHSILNFSSGDQGIYSAIYNREAPWYVSAQVQNKIYVLKPLEILTSNKKNKNIMIEFSDDNNFKPGFKLQAKEILNYFQSKKYNLVNYKEMFKTINIIKKIYN